MTPRILAGLCASSVRLAAQRLRRQGITGAPAPEEYAEDLVRALLQAPTDRGYRALLRQSVVFLFWHCSCAAAPKG